MRLRSALRTCPSKTRLETFAATLDADDIALIERDWALWGRLDQLPPDIRGGAAGWTVWILLGGRGAGKTRAGAEWIRAQALGIAPMAVAPASRIALVGQTMGDARSVMVEGVSGLLAVHGDGERPLFEPSRRQLTWPNGCIAQLFSAEEPDALRGPQFDVAWCDELAKWRNGDAAWDMLQFALRLGHRPRQVVTTTPRAVPLLKRLMAQERTVVSRASTRDNAHNLAPGFLEAVVARYEGTRLGRQELDGELIEDDPHALFRRDAIEGARISRAPELARIVVAVDPPVTSGEGANACGIVCAGRGLDGRAYVLADGTVERASPMRWARAAVALYRAFCADRLVAEVNQGGDLVTAVMHEADPDIPVRCVRASRGKRVRAEPVAALYEQGRVSHAGTFPELEDEMCAFDSILAARGRSPDRVDALVWALTELMLSRTHGAPKVRTL